MFISKKVKESKMNIYIFLWVSAATALPQLQVTSPEEINALEGGIVQRSISDNVGSDNTDDTVKEVERLIQSNPELPRLTRGEILDILENITKSDNNVLLKSISKDSERDPKALMVVKAYTPQGFDEANVQEFYTKAPVTSIVEDPSSEPPRKSTAPYFRRKTTKAPEDKGQQRKKPSRGSVSFRTTLLSTTTTEKLGTTEYTTPSTTTTTTKRRRRPTTIMPVTTFRPRRRQQPKKEIRYPNHKYSEEVTATPPYFSGGIRIIRPPVITQSPIYINSELEDLLPLEMEHEEHRVAMPAEHINAPEHNFNGLSEPSIELEIPEHLKKVVADLNLAAIQDPESLPTQPKKEADKIKDVLASIGVFPPINPTTTTTSADAVAENLSPDMRELLKNFGLLPDPQQDNKKNEIPDINPESYSVGFKPLPEDTSSRKEMEDLLAQFGLLDTKARKATRRGKDLKKKLTVDQVSLDVVPDDLKPVLENMGFESGRLARKVRHQPAEQLLEKPEESTTRQHVFSPTEKNVSEEEIQKLGKLLEVMKKLDKLNGTITEDDIKDIDKEELRELIASLNQEQQSEDMTPLFEQKAPNPLEFDFSDDKNDVKRQQTTPEPTAGTPENIPEDTKTPSIKDLEDSFGGSTESVTEALPEATTRRSGFYYLLDWNTFLEIDDQKGKRVNLRFQPKVGDPKRFYNVKVP